MAVVAGVTACLLSLSRGSWLVLMCAVPVWAWLAAPHEECGRWQARLRQFTTAAGVATVAVAVLWQLPQFNQRIEQAASERSQWQQRTSEHPNAATSSIGQRLEQWRVHWALIQERPFRGWGLEGITQAKREWVQQGRVHESVLDYNHAHNEVLHVWASRGLLGLAVLLAVYCAPIALLWPTAERRGKVPLQHHRAWQALAVAAMCVPLTAAIAGLTQVFFAHNSGDFFYAFTLVFLLGAMQGLEDAKIFS